MDIVKGSDKILLFRIEGEEGDAWKMTFQTEHERSESQDYESTETKDGSTMSPGAYEATYSLTALYEQGSTKIADVKDALRNSKKLEIWEVETYDIETESVGGEYSEAYLTSVSESAPAEGNIELSMEATVQGKPISGDVDVTSALKALIARADAERAFVQPTEEV